MTFDPSLITFDAASQGVLYAGRPVPRDCGLICILREESGRLIGMRASQTVAVEPIVRDWWDGLSHWQRQDILGKGVVA